MNTSDIQLFLNILDSDGDSKVNKSEFVTPLEKPMAMMVLEDLLASDDYDKWIKEVKDGKTKYTELDHLFPYAETKLSLNDLK